jgi:hypothetical protein
VPDTADVDRRRLTTDKVRHQFAAMNWKSGYASWLVERQKMAGWVDILDHRKNAFVKEYFMLHAGRALGPIRPRRSGD